MLKPLATLLNFVFIVVLFFYFPFYVFFPVPPPRHISFFINFNFSPQSILRSRNTFLDFQIFSGWLLLPGQYTYIYIFLLVFLARIRFVFRCKDCNNRAFFIYRFVHVWNCRAISYVIERYRIPVRDNLTGDRGKQRARKRQRELTTVYEIECFVRYTYVTKG